MKKLFTVLLTAGLLIGTVNAAETDKTGRAILGISPDTNEIAVKAVTADGSAIQVEGCTVEELPSGESVRLTATGNRIVLKGAITELDCSKNQLTSLDVRGVTALVFLNCAENQLSEKAFIRILNALPDRKQSKAGKARIYRERNDVPEKNVTNFSSSAELKTAFEAAKAKNWEFYKLAKNGAEEKI